MGMGAAMVNCSLCGVGEMAGKFAALKVQIHSSTRLVRVVGLAVAVRRFSGVAGDLHARNTVSDQRSSTAKTKGHSESKRRRQPGALCALGKCKVRQNKLDFKVSIEENLRKMNKI